MTDLKFPGFGATWDNNCNKLSSHSHHPNYNGDPPTSSNNAAPNGTAVDLSPNNQGKSPSNPVPAAAPATPATPSISFQFHAGDPHDYQWQIPNWHGPATGTFPYYRSDRD
jgi:hypothetical protein